MVAAGSGALRVCGTIAGARSKRFEGTKRRIGEKQELLVVFDGKRAVRTTAGAATASRFLAKHRRPRTLRTIWSVPGTCGKANDVILYYSKAFAVAFEILHVEKESCADCSPGSSSASFSGRVARATRATASLATCSTEVRALTESIVFFGGDAVSIRLSHKGEAW